MNFNPRALNFLLFFGCGLGLFLRSFHFFIFFIFSCFTNAMLHVLTVTCKSDVFSSADDKPMVNGEHPAAESSQDADADESQAAADDSQLAAVNDTSAMDTSAGDVTGDSVTVHVM